jgi:hypothetical protein
MLVKPSPARLLLVFLALSAPASGGAQAVQQRLQTEGRIDAIVSEQSAVHAGLGMSVPAGLYVRAGLVLGAGIGGYGFDGRTDLIGRFTFDPLRQSRWAPYGGGGLSARFNSTADGGAKGYLLFFLGVEGPVPFGRTRGWVPAFEMGLGGGARFGVIIRRGVHARR